MGFMSATMNGYVHGKRYVAGFAYYKYIIIAVDILAISGIALTALFEVRRQKKAKKESNN